MLKRLFLCFGCLVASISLFASVQPANNPKAADEATVVAGNARFTVLTDRLIRMEWAEDGVFEDRASLGITNRNLPVPQFSSKVGKNKVVIKTSSLTLTYLPCGKFTCENLSVSFSMKDSRAKKGVRKVCWRPGADESANLLGTFRTLDGCEGFAKINSKNDPYEKGILSRDGWAVIDESNREVLEKNTSDWGEWIVQRSKADRQDLYLFAYGHDYKAALGDFTKVAGNIPLPPKYAFGYWWSRYWQYSDFEFLDLAKEIRSHNVPVDVMVIDMDWHDTWTLQSNKKTVIRDEFGERVGWTGYSWQKELFPNPEKFLKKLHELDCKTSLNLHPASGIQPYEDCYERFVADYVSRTDDYHGPRGYVYNEGDSIIYRRSTPSTNKHVAMHKGDKCPVPFRISQKAWTDAYFNSVIHPLEKQGVDFWWLDWQQWKTSEYLPGLNITFWLNWCFFNDKVRQSVLQGPGAARPMIYHRWGGLGSHRYQIGFSGDCYDTWEVLRFLPYFTATSSNVGYGYWGHDIGGHQCSSLDNPYKPETFTRWLQFSVFTPIFKTHSTKNARIERRVWVYPDAYRNPMIASIRLRYSLSPYIYTTARQAFDTGICICRPLYYDWPEKEEAYSMKEEFMFGDNILATTVCEPCDSVTALAERKVWFPDGCSWYDMATGCMYEGGTTKTLYYTIDENPWYVKAGAIIPMAGENISSLQKKDSELRIFIAPGDGESSYDLYEDDNDTQSYLSEYAITHISKISDAQSAHIKLCAAKGEYPGKPATRKIGFVLEAVPAPQSVRVNGKDAKWSYNGADLALCINVPYVDCSKDLDVEIVYGEAVADGKTIQGRELLLGKKGIFHRMMAITPEMKNVFNVNVDTYRLIDREFLKFAQCSSKITYDPAGALGYIQQLDIKALQESLQKTLDSVKDLRGKEKTDAAKTFFKKIITQITKF